MRIAHEVSEITSLSESDRAHVGAGYRDTNVDIAVGTFNVSASSIIDYLRSNAAGIDTHLHGYVYLRQGHLVLAVWGQARNGALINYTTQPQSDPDLLAKDVAIHIVRTFDPFTFVAFTFTQERSSGDTHHKGSLNLILELLNASRKLNFLDVSNTLSAEEKAWLLNLWGLILYEQKDYASAVSKFNIIVQTTPPFILPVNSFERYMDLIASQFDPRVLELAYANRGDALRHLGKLTDALESYYKSGLWPEKFSPALASSDSDLLAKQDTDVTGTQERLSAMSEAIEKNPGDPTLYFDRAKARAEIGDLSGAKSDFKSAGTLAHDNIDFFVREAEFCNRHGYTTIAIDLLGSPPSGSKADRVDVWYELSIAYKAQGKVDLESSAAMHAIDLLDPDHRKSRY